MRKTHPLALRRHTIKQLDASLIGRVVGGNDDTTKDSFDCPLSWAKPQGCHEPIGLSAEKYCSEHCGINPTPSKPNKP